jgi:hypothetical protein
LLRFAQIGVAANRPDRFPPALGREEPVMERKKLSRMAGKQGKVSCEDCYFKQNLLCALPMDEPCATFRPDHPDGLRPPTQLRFVFRQERSRQSAWAFPSAQEPASLHA